MIATRSNGWIGVDIGTRTVKLAQVVRDHMGLRIIDAAIVARSRPWSSEAISSQHPMSTQAEIRTARSIAARTKGRAAACCATTALCSIASIPLDAETQAPDQEELTHTLSLPSNSLAIVDYCRAGKPPRNLNDAIVFAISEPWSEQLAADVQDAGFRCHAIDATPLALARATVADASTPRNRCIAAIDLGYSSTTFIVASDGEPCFLRSMDRCSLRAFTDDLIKDLGIDLGQAERLLAKVGLGPTNAKSNSLEFEAQGVREILKPAFTDLVDEIKRTFMYLQTHQPTRVPHEIKLFGGGACIPGLVERLSSTLGIDVSVWRPAYEVEAASHSIVPLLAPAIAVSMLPWEAKQ